MRRALASELRQLQEIYNQQLKELEQLLEKLMPLVGTVTRKLHLLMLINIAVISWLFVFMFVLQEMPINWTLAISVKN